MGNESSRLKGLIIDKNAIETTDFWAIYNATIPNNDAIRDLSVFQGEAIVNGQLWVTQSPMERAIKNLMIYRHPCILKYIASWEQGGQKYLATERIRPLNSILSSQSSIQICLGLRNILCSLIFLIEQANARHLNIAIPSIYINDEGDWRLGGFEYVWKTKDITKALLDLTTAYRYKDAVDPNETKNNGDCIEQYGFATLCEDILSSKNAIAVNSTPNSEDFKDYCTTHLKHNDVTLRPKLSAILLHPYFNHEFVFIHSFLVELPLKNPQEKQDFFTSLIDRLRYFDEKIVASQIGNLLLSRMVLLDATAQLCVTPYVLRTKTDISAALFSNQTFIKYMIPRIKQMFSIRDAQMRLILLEYFNEYVKLLTKNELQEFILPHLLEGIKDTNDILVAKTLRCMADLVPLLGSAAVLGGTRSRLFADGRPQALSDTKTTSHWVEPRSITPVVSSGELMVSASPLPDNVDLGGSYNSIENSTSNHQNGSRSSSSGDDVDDDDGDDDNVPNINASNGNTADDEIAIGSNNVTENMPTRLSPDGGEDIHIATDGEVDDEAWSDWENDELNRIQQLPQDGILLLQNQTVQSLINDDQQLLSLQKNSGAQSPRISSTDSFKTSSSTSVTTSKIIIDDISELDIKVQRLPATMANGDEFDYFKDMEPIIETPTSSLDLSPLATDRTVIPEHNDNTLIHRTDSKLMINCEEIQIDKSRFEFKTLDDVDPVGWGDDDEDWAE